MSDVNGIDLARSGWENPEGFTPRPRDRGHVVVVKVCEAPGPGGLVCDLPPNHQPTDEHKADDGSPNGIRWTGRMANVQALHETEPVLIPAYDPNTVTVLQAVAGAVNDTLAEIATLAEAAMSNPSPAFWAVTLGKILELCRD